MNDTAAEYTGFMRNRIAPVIVAITMSEKNKTKSVAIESGKRDMKHVVYVSLYYACQ